MLTHFFGKVFKRFTIFKAINDCYNMVVVGFLHYYYKSHDNIQKHVWQNILLYICIKKISFAELLQLSISQMKKYMNNIKTNNLFQYSKS